MLNTTTEKKLFIVLCSASQPPYRAFIFMNGVSKHVLLLLKWQLHKSKSYLPFFLSKPGRKFPTKRTFIWTSDQARPIWHCYVIHWFDIKFNVNRASLPLLMLRTNSLTVSSHCALLQVQAHFSCSEHLSSSTLKLADHPVWVHS